MKWIKRSVQISQAVRNVPRLRDIVSVFAKNGFVDVVERTHLGRYLPRNLKTYATTHRTTANRLRTAFEELGPTFIKLGQILSTRSDLLPESFIVELKKLQDQVEVQEFAAFEKTLRNHFGESWKTKFAHFSTTPLGTASMSQVYEARLTNGEEVVVKIQRPEIKKIIEQDLFILKFIATLLEKYIPETRVVSPQTLVQEFFNTITLELDFRVEANNIKKITENFKDRNQIVIPKVFDEFTHEKVLVLQKISGVRMDDLIGIENLGISKTKLVEVGARALFESIMIDGFFHGDLHAGNLFVLPDGKIAMIDFGIVGRLSEKSRITLTNMLLALYEEDYANLCYQYAELGLSTTSIDFDQYEREVRNTLSPYLGMSIQNINIGKVLIDATRVALKYEIRLPGEWMIVFRSMVTLETIGRKLDPNFDMLFIGKDMMKDLLKTYYSPQKISKDLLWSAKDFLNLVQTLPRHFRFLLKKRSRDDFALEIKIRGLDQLEKTISKNNKRLVFSLLTSAFLFSFVFFIQRSPELGFRFGIQEGVFLFITLLFLFLTLLT